MPPGGEAHLSKLDRRRLVDARCREALVSGQRVCVDLSMEHLMTDKVIRGGVEVNKSALITKRYTEFTTSNRNVGEPEKRADI